MRCHQVASVGAAHFQDFLSWHVGIASVAHSHPLAAAGQPLQSLQGWPLRENLATTPAGRRAARDQAVWPEHVIGNMPYQCQSVAGDRRQIIQHDHSAIFA